MVATKHLSVAALASTPRLSCHISMLQNICAKLQYFTVRVLKELYKQNKKRRNTENHALANMVIKHIRTHADTSGNKYICMCVDKSGYMSKYIYYINKVHLRNCDVY